MNSIQGECDVHFHILNILETPQNEPKRIHSDCLKISSLFWIVCSIQVDFVDSFQRRKFQSLQSPSPIVTDDREHIQIIFIVKLYFWKKVFEQKAICSAFSTQMANQRNKHFCFILSEESHFI